MSTEETDWTIAKLQAEIEELRERVAELELRVAGGHDCLIDLCSFGDDGECRLAGRAAWEDQ